MGMFLSSVPLCVHVPSACSHVHWREDQWAGLAGKAFSVGAAGRVPWREQRRGSGVSSLIGIDKGSLVGPAEAAWVRGPAGARV